MKSSVISDARKRLHRQLAKDTLMVDSKGVPTNSDGSNVLSVKLAKAILVDVPSGKCRKRPNGQTLGLRMEKAVLAFVKKVFPSLQHLRPGKWIVEGGQTISQFQQYGNLTVLENVLKSSKELRVSVGTDYIIKPDVIIARKLETDSFINTPNELVDDECAILADIRKSGKESPLALLHASISCKWTMRSDRAQNSRSEELNLIRYRKGRLPHVVVVTAEPLPSRLASLCLGTGDLDCVYHIALPELREAIIRTKVEGVLELLDDMINGKRLKDISDLPLDLAV